MAALGSRIARILRHRWWDESDARRALPLAAVQRIEAQVTASERRHSGQIRVSVEAGLPLGYLWRDLGPRQRAVTLFGKLRVWDTAQNNGVLIYLLLAEHAIEIVADRGLNAQVAAADWQAIVARMGEPLRAGRFEDALNQAMDDVDALLTRHFPRAADETRHNELPDRIDLR